MIFLDFVLYRLIVLIVFIILLIFVCMRLFGVGYFLNRFFVILLIVIFVVCVDSIIVIISLKLFVKFSFVFVFGKSFFK